jgi:hypothetical protein
MRWQSVIDRPTWPKSHENGPGGVIESRSSGENNKYRPFSCATASIEEHPGPPFVLDYDDYQSSCVCEARERNLPESDIIDSLFVGSREEPEKQFALLIRIRRYGKQARITLSDVDCTMGWPVSGTTGCRQMSN